MSKKLTIEVTDRQYDLFKRIALEDKRKLNDLVRLVLLQVQIFIGLKIIFHFKKRDDEFTPEEKKQIAKMKDFKQLEKKKTILSTF